MGKGYCETINEGSINGWLNWRSKKWNTGCFDHSQFLCFHLREIRWRPTRMVQWEQKTKAICHQWVFWSSRILMNFLFPKSLKIKNMRSKTMLITAFSGLMYMKWEMIYGFWILFIPRTFPPHFSLHLLKSLLYLHNVLSYFVQIIIINLSCLPIVIPNMSYSSWIQFRRVLFSYLPSPLSTSQYYL